MGFDIDLSKGYILVPTSKIERLKLLIRSALDGNIIPIKHIASIVGKIISMGLGIGPVSHFRTRSLYEAMNLCNSWYESTCLVDTTKDELLFLVRMY